MVINFRACEISRGTHKLTQTPTLIKKKTDREVVVGFSKNFISFFFFLLFLYVFVWKSLSPLISCVHLFLSKCLLFIPNKISYKT